MKSHHWLGILCLIFAFGSASQRDDIWSFLGFLPFFIVGVALLTRDKWMPKDPKDTEGPKQN